jgi:hypothetical protein
MCTLNEWPEPLLNSTSISKPSFGSRWVFRQPFFLVLLEGPRLGEERQVGPDKTRFWPFAEWRRHSERCPLFVGVMAHLGMLSKATPGLLGSQGEERNNLLILLSNSGKRKGVCRRSVRIRFPLGL